MFGLTAKAQSPAEVAASSAQTTQPAEPASAKSPVTELKLGDGSNSIPLLDNRFRIDYEVNEITLVFFRKKGAPSIVLVRPDGSKIYARTAKEQGIEWFDDKTYDLIKMVKPTPGPWQAIGEVLPESRIMVLTDIGLDTDPLPSDLMLGELLKVTARLSNGGKPVNVRDFRDILQLQVLLISTQKAEYDNAHSTVMEFASFQDDGKNYDEKPRDAIFTGEFNFNIQAGEWLPKYIVKTPLYTRELMQPPVLVSRTPIKIDVVEGLAPEERHQLTYQVTDGHIDAKSLIVQGRLRFPGGEVQSFSLGEQDSDKRELAVANAGIGAYRVEQMLFGKTKSGRDFVINLPEYSFAAVGPKVAVPDAPPAEKPAGGDVPGATPATDTANAAAANTGEPASEPAEPPAEFPLGLVIAVNLLILIGGGLAILLVTNANAQLMLKMLWAKLNPLSLLKKRKEGAETAAQPASQAVPKAADADVMAKKAPKNKASDDILDLSLPDD